ncbi:MAG: homoserine dehydrogenase [Candidatus Stahlbacteria bacterium]|nr:homoserine dehydrogenase [Candidatus Stahlbacteria bacterium]
MKYKIGLVGFGTVGQGFVEILAEKGAEFKEKYGMEVEVVAISDPIKGSVYAEEGLNLNKVLELKGDLSAYPNCVKGWDSIKTITATNADVIVEVTPTNIKTGEPGLTHIRAALNNNKHTITTNKGPVALAYSELAALSLAKGVNFRFEGTVMAGTPSLNVGLEALAGIGIKEIRGILNGTTNYILTNMEQGTPYSDALSEAQKLGYAEAKPDADVEGWDALAKVVILGNVVMGGNLKVEDIERQGITGLTVQDIETAKSEGKCYKLIGKVWREGNQVKGSVEPQKLNKSDLLAQVGGVRNAITFVTDELNEVTITGPGAGRRETGFAIISDLINLHRKQ